MTPVHIKMQRMLFYVALARRCESMSVVANGAAVGRLRISSRGRRSRARATSSLAMPRISRLISYPIKSLPGVSCERIALTSTGLALDRVFALVDAETKVFVSQRSHPKLATLGVRVHPVEAFVDPSITKFDVVVSASGMEDLVIACDVRSTSGASASNAMDIECWEWRGECIDVGEGATKWFSDFMNDGKRYSCVRWAGRGGFPGNEQDVEGVDVDDAVTRLTSEEYGSRRATTTLTDGFPMLLVNQASIDAVNAGAKALDPERAPNVDGRRFRGNVIVDDCPPFAEDRWASARIADRVDVELCKPCSRCSIPNIDPETGKFDVSHALAKHMSQARSGAALGTANRFWRQAVFFGWNIITTAPQDARTVLAVGDDVKVTSTRSKFP